MNAHARICGISMEKMAVYLVHQYSLNRFWLKVYRLMLRGKVIFQYLARCVLGNRYSLPVLLKYVLLHAVFLSSA